MPTLGRSGKRPAAQPHRQPIERLREDTRKSVWYAFDTLANADTKQANKSQLKLVTSTVGVPLGFDKSEEILNNDTSTHVGFQEYIDLIEREIFDRLTSQALESLNLSDNDLEGIHRSCWMLYLQLKKEPKGSKENLNRTIPESVSYQLWRVFNFLAEEDDEGKPILPIQLHRDEASLVLNSFVESTGQVSLLSQIETLLCGFMEPLSFQQFEMLLESKFLQSLSENCLKHASLGLFEKFIGDTLLKGMICKRGHSVKHWKDRWMVLNSRELKYYVTSAEKEMKGSIILDKTCSVEMLPERGGAKPNRFVLKTTQKPYEMSACDTKTRNEWMSALQRVIDKSSEKNFHFRKNELLSRRQYRNEVRRQKEEEERKRKEEEERMRKMQEDFDEKLRLEELEKQKLQEALNKAGMSQEELQEKLRLEEELRKQEQQRLRELEEIRKELERLLEEERQAKRDEEIVRGLQARLLLEEEEKREELERLRAEQEELLKSERERREGLEERQQEQAQKLQDAQDWLNQLEQQRISAEQKLQAASDKLHEAEKERQMMEEKMEKERQQAKYKEKLWSSPTIGLAKPLPIKVDAKVTHRGHGAFCDLDFTKRQESLDENVSEKSNIISDTNETVIKAHDHNIEIECEKTLNSEKNNDVETDNTKHQNNNEKDKRLLSETEEEIPV